MKLSNLLLFFDFCDSSHIVTDGGSAFCKAFKVFGIGIDELCGPIGQGRILLPSPMNIDNGPTMNEVAEDVEQTEEGEITSIEELPYAISHEGEEFYADIISFDESVRVMDTFIDDRLNGDDELNLSIEFGMLNDGVRRVRS